MALTVNPIKEGARLPGESLYGDGGRHKSQCTKLLNYKRSGFLILGIKFPFPRLQEDIAK